MTIFILANKDELDKFNIDKYSIYTFVLSGIMLFLSFGLSFLGIIAIASSLTAGKILFDSKGKLNRNYLYTLLFVAIGMTPEILLRLFSPEFYQDSFSELSIGTIFVIISTILWNVIFEEMLFRSILWKILYDWNFSSRKIILIQAFLFWLVHFDFITTRALALGLPVLVFGIWVGFLTLRSKSLMPSTTTHFFHNITSSLFS